MHNDEEVPPEHVPCGHRHPGPGAEEEVRRQAGARRQLFVHAG